MPAKTKAAAKNHRPVQHQLFCDLIPKVQQFFGKFHSTLKATMGHNSIASSDAS
jgi:hypothetical protein